MYSRLKVILIAGITLIVGAIGGTMAGLELSSRFWHRMSQGTAAFPGTLAYISLHLLDRKAGTPTIQLYEDLRRYRQEHLFNARTNVITTH